MQDVMSVNHKEYKIAKLLGHGKGGYSYLAEREGNFYVLKQIHHCQSNCKKYLSRWPILKVGHIRYQVIMFERVN